jgi:hypothetical protein
MKTAERISGQFSDLFCYLLIPGLSLILPAAFSRQLLLWVSGWGWILKRESGAACDGAGKHIDIADETAWKRRWKQVELLDARDLFMMTFGRSRSVLGEIQCAQPIETAKDRVMVGMHWGPGISILKLLAIEGLQPSFPFRPPERRLLRSRPFYYLFSTLVARYLSSTLKDRAVPVGGAGKVLEGLLGESGSICVLMDAPPMQGRSSWSGQVLDRAAHFNAGFPAMMAGRKKEYLLYAMNLDHELGKRLELEGPFSADGAGEFLQRYATFLDRHLSSDSSQWRIWHVEKQFWSDRH